MSALPGTSVDPRVPTGNLAMNDRQRETLTKVYARYPAPMVVGWRGDCWPEAPFVRGSIYMSTEDDEAGNRCGEFTIDRSGEIHWLFDNSGVEEDDRAS